MHVDLEWDDAAYILALMEHVGVSDRQLRSVLIDAMREYDGQSSSRATMTPDIRKRVDFWKSLLKD